MTINEIRNPIAQFPVLKKTQSSCDETKFEEQLKNTSSTASKSSDVSSAQKAKERPAALTNSEKEYFQQLYPNASDEIQTYNPYHRDGARTAAQLGSMLDRKG